MKAVDPIVDTDSTPYVDGELDAGAPHPGGILSFREPCDGGKGHGRSSA